MWWWTLVSSALKLELIYFTVRPNIWSLLWYPWVKYCFGVQSLALFSLEIKFFLIFNAQLFIQEFVVYHWQYTLGQFWFISLFWLCSWNTGLLSPPHMSSCPWAFCFIDSCRASMSSDALVHCCNPELEVYNAWLKTGHLWVHYVPQKHQAVWDPKHKNDKTEVAFWQAYFNLRWDSGEYLRMKREDN